MSLPELSTAAKSPQALAELNAWLGTLSAPERIDWALRHLPGPHALSSSFGAQAAVSLHMATQAKPDIPVILIDTGYLFPETYRFVDEMTERLGLNLKVYRPQVGIAWMEARYGRLWEQGIDGLKRYNHLRKVEPMQRALRELGIQTWIAGLRRGQSEAAPRSTFWNCATAVGNCIRWPTGATAKSGNICNSTNCPITRFGTKAISRSAISTPRAHSKPVCAKKTPASSA